MFTAALLDLVVETARDSHFDISLLTELAAEAQWFAVANSQGEGARSLTRCRNRSEVLREVNELRQGRSSPAVSPPRMIAKNSGGCHGWLCPTVADLPIPVSLPVFA